MQGSWKLCALHSEHTHTHTGVIASEGIGMGGGGGVMAQLPPRPIIHRARCVDCLQLRHACKLRTVLSCLMAELPPAPKTPRQSSLADFFPR